MQTLDTRTLFATGRELKLPASLAVRLDDAQGQPATTLETLELIRLFRILPGKRVVALARWQGQLVVAKIFFARGRWAGHLAREQRGIAAITAAGVATPIILGSGAGADGDSGMLLLQYLDDSESVGQRWQRSDAASRGELLRRVVALIACCHDHGLQQKDIHLDNFLLQGDGLYLLDAAAVERSDSDQGGLDTVNSLRNLALFFAQFPISNDAQVPALYDYYRSLRTHADISPELGVFAALLRKKRLARLKVVLDKLFRTTSANICLRRWDRYVMYTRRLESEALHAFLADPDVAIARGTPLKKGNTSTVAIVQIAGCDYVLKRYNIRNFWHGLSRLFRPSRAWVCWRNAHMLEMFGIDTPRPLLMMERRCGFLRRQAYFLCEHVPGVDALRFFEQEPVHSPALMRSLEQFRNLFLVMQDYGIVHGDMKASNFICSETALTVLDLDAMRQELDRRRFAVAFKKDLQRFADNWNNRPELAVLVQELVEMVLTDSDKYSKGT